MSTSSPRHTSSSAIAPLGPDALVVECELLTGEVCKMEVLPLHTVGELKSMIEDTRRGGIAGHMFNLLNQQGTVLEDHESVVEALEGQPCGANDLPRLQVAMSDNTELAEAINNVNHAITFNQGRMELVGMARHQLQRISGLLEQHPYLDVLVEAHLSPASFWPGFIMCPCLWCCACPHIIFSPNTGCFAPGYALAQRRANAVKAVLCEGGVERSRIFTRTYACGDWSRQPRCEIYLLSPDHSQSFPARAADLPPLPSRACEALGWRSLFVMVVDDHGPPRFGRVSGVHRPPPHTACTAPP